MSKIIEFRSKNKNTLEFVDEFKDLIEEENLENLVVGCKTPKGEVLIGYTHNLDYGTIQEIVSHMQTHLIMRMMKGK